ncbi:hypothetical protein IW249_003943 [Micromonospora vinacea]|uniref:Uncharacterized protein n=1 Tax=Micromonospora vinacea TaxID=709878 RepID=A0ABS0K4K7_9ACTN|nr:hypothetical protein [Micromonospora vinacea]
MTGSVRHLDFNETESIKRQLPAWRAADQASGRSQDLREDWRVAKAMTLSA